MKTEKEQMEFFEKLIWTLQVFWVHGLVTHKEYEAINKRLVKRITEDGYKIEHTGFRQFKVYKGIEE